VTNACECIHQNLPRTGAGWSDGRESAERDLPNMRFIQGGNCARDAAGLAHKTPSDAAGKLPLLSGSTALY
jgi:hypothetical protein